MLRAPARAGGLRSPLPREASAGWSQAVASGAVAGSSWVIRNATPQDGEFLTDMLVAAVNWSPERKPRSRRRVLAVHGTAHYIAGWPRGTDLGVIAEAGAAPAGAAWIRFFTAEGRRAGGTATGRLPRP
jgi:hypothetical protein